MSTAPVTILSYGVVTNGKEKERIAHAVRDANFGVVIADEVRHSNGRPTAPCCHCSAASC